uniref:Reverse transcriptase domain-containing protein n=1 Tax=Tanacetum cinerariifolium TaxID=118510 RepID=A0A6L2JJI3_TANCI|nr:hypothetical protein [Tanacetum cinerariifolium]
MSSASSAVTYTSVYTDSEPGRVFWGADKKLSDEGSPRVIVYGYDGLPMRLVAPPSLEYIHGPEEPQTPPASQDEDEREPMFIQPHDPDYVPEPMYPEYIPLEDEHGISVEEQPLPPIDSLTVVSLGYVAESDPEEYEDDETEDGPVDYPMDGGDDGEDDDRDSSSGDIDDEDEDEEEEEEEEHLASTDSAIFIPTVELISPPEGTEPATISLSLEAEVKRLLAMPTPLPSPLASLSPPSAEERLARCTAPFACPSPPPIPTQLLSSFGCPTQIQTLRMASTQAFIDAVTAALPSPSLPQPLYIPAPVDHRDDILETEMPPRKRLCFSTLGSRYEIEESSTSRPIEGRGIDYGFVSTLDAEARRRGIKEVGNGIRDTWVDLAEAVPEIAPITLGERVDLLMEDMTAHQETILIVEEEAYATREAWAHSIGLSQSVHSKIQTHRDQVYTHEFQLQAHQTQLRLQMVETLRVIGDMRREMGDMQAKSLALQEQPRRARQPGEDARVPDHQDAPRDVKGNDVPAYTKHFQKPTLIGTKFVSNETEKIEKYIGGLLDNIYGSVKASKPKTLDETIELANDLMNKKLCTYAERQTNNIKKDDDSFKNNHGHQQQIAKRQNVAKIYNMGSGESKPYEGNLPKSSGNANVTNAHRNNGTNPKGNVGNAEKKGNASRDPDSNVVTGTFLLKNRYASILLDTGAYRSFISTVFSSLIDIVPTPLGNSYDVELADSKIVGVDTIMQGCTLNFLNHPFNVDLMPIELGSFDVITGRCHAVIVWDEKLVRVPYGNETLIFHGDQSNDGKEYRLTIISCSKAQEYMAKGCQIFLTLISAKKEEDKSEGKQLKDVPIIRDFPELFLEDLSGLPLARPVEF